MAAWIRTSNGYVIRIDSIVWISDGGQGGGLAIHFPTGVQPAVFQGIHADEVRAGLMEAGILISKTVNAAPQRDG